MKSEGDMKSKLFAAALCFIVIVIMSISISGCSGIGSGRGETTRIPITIYKSAAIDIRARNIDSIAVTTFFGKKDEGKKASYMLAQALADTLIYTVKKPDDVDSDLLVNGLGLKRYMEKSELKALGAALKVDAFFMGEVLEREIGDEVYNKVITEQEGTGEFEFIKNKQGKLEYQEKKKEVDVKMECKTRVGKIKINYKLYDAKTGKIIINTTEYLSEEVDAFCYRTSLNPTQMSSIELETLLDEVMEELSNNFVEQLTPPSKTELIVFEKIPGADSFSSNLVKIGIDYAKIGKWKKAIESFEQCQRINRKHSEANYNLGIAYKGYGWYEKALVQFKDANRLKPKKLYKEAIRKTTELIEESRKKTEE